MINKFQTKLKQIKQKLNNINEIYLDYFLCISFLTIIFSKINNFFFQISSMYLYPIIISLSIIFINQWLFITNIIKNTSFFNYILYYFLIIKNNIYKLIFDYFEYVEYEKYTKLIIFLTGFILSSWILNIFFIIINNSYNLSIIIFILLLLINILNLIEKKLIFNEKNLLKNNQEIDYKQVCSFLAINNSKFKKNHSLFYIQKRYTMHFSELKKLIKKHGPLVLNSVVAGTLFTGAIQVRSINVQKEQIDFMKLQHQDKMELAEKQMTLNEKQMALNEKQMVLTEKQIIIQRKKDLDYYLSKYNELINDVYSQKYKLQRDMDSRYFWNKIDLLDLINELEKEKNYLKRLRTKYEKERDSFYSEKLKTNINFEQSNSNKKPKLNNDDFLFDE